MSFVSELDNYLNKSLHRNISIDVYKNEDSENHLNREKSIQSLHESNSILIINYVDITSIQRTQNSNLEASSLKNIYNDGNENKLEINTNSFLNCSVSAISTPKHFSNRKIRKSVSNFYDLNEYNYYQKSFHFIIPNTEKIQHSIFTYKAKTVIEYININIFYLDDNIFINPNRKCTTKKNEKSCLNKSVKLNTSRNSKIIRSKSVNISKSRMIKPSTPDVNNSKINSHTPPPLPPKPLYLQQNHVLPKTSPDSDHSFSIIKPPKPQLPPKSINKSIKIFKKADEDLEKKTILIIEEDKACCRKLEKVIKSLDYNCYKIESFIKLNEIPLDSIIDSVMFGYNESLSLEEYCRLCCTLNSSMKVIAFLKNKDLSIELKKMLIDKGIERILPYPPVSWMVKVLLNK